MWECHCVFSTTPQSYGFWPPAVQETLKALEIAAKGTDNLLPHILNAVKTYATLGEIADVFREVFGKHRETVVL